MMIRRARPDVTCEYVAMMHCSWSLAFKFHYYSSVSRSSLMYFVYKAYKQKVDKFRSRSDTDSDM